MTGDPFAGDRTSSRFLEGLIAGDDLARRRLVEAYRIVLRGILHRYSLTAEERDDLAQAFWVRVFTKISSFRKERPADSLRGWLRVVARNLIIEHLRSKGVRNAAQGGSENLGALAQLADDSPVEDAVEADERRALLQAALGHIERQIAPRDFENFRRTTVGGEPIAAVAEARGMNPAALRMANARIRQKLRQFLGDLWD